jgi:hypothetical protein
MIRPALLFAAAALCTALVAALSAATPDPAGADAARVVANLNIFDSTRIDRTGRPAARPATPAPTPQTIILVGTMSYAKGLYAFFDSPEPAWRKVLPASATIAGFTIARIQPDGVVLTRAGASFPLRITRQLRRSPGGDWSVADAPPIPAAPAADAPADNPASSPLPANASDALRRLMEQRQQELHKS